jgi:branched-chain amino acid transport system substrate-binding protein
MDRRDVLKTIVAAGAGAAVSSAMAQPSPTIKLGLITSLSGPVATVGQSMLTGAEIAVDQINAVGGVLGRKLELVTRDDKAKPTDGTVAARELAGNGVNLLFGVSSSAVALAIVAMLEQEKALLITCAAHSERLTKENFVRNYFRITDNPYMRERAMAKVCAQRYPTINRWSGIIPDHDYGRATWACFEDGLAEFYPALAKQKAVVTQPLKTAYGAADYRSTITASMALPADGFFISVYGGDAVTFFKQAEPFGFFKKAKVIIDSGNELMVAKAMKQDLPEMWVGAHWIAAGFKDVAVSRELHAEATRRTKDANPLGFVSEAHAAVVAYAKAIQAAGSVETQAVLSALESIKFETATGTRSFRKEDHQAIRPSVFFKVRGSAKSSDGFEVLEVMRIPGADVIDPPTPGQALKLRTA